MKKTNKKTKYSYVVDITDCNTVNDVEVAFAIAKQKAGIPLSDSNLDAIINHTVEQVVDGIQDVVIVCDCEKPKKLPWYKRFWNWLTFKK